MHSLPAIEGTEPPRLVRAVCLQLLALTGAAMLAALPWPRTRKAPAEPAPEPKREERRIRVVQLPRPPPPRPAEPAPATPPAKAAPPRPAPPRPASAAAAPQAPAQAPAHIAVDSTSVHGVRMRVLVPRSPEELAQHLRNSGGCLVVSRLDGTGAEVLSALSIDGSRANP